MPIPGILIYGTTTFLSSDGESSEVSQEPVYLTASMVDSAIATGSLKAGALNNVTVQPPREEWPSRWLILKE